MFEVIKKDSQQNHAPSYFVHGLTAVWPHAEGIGLSCNVADRPSWRCQARNKNESNACASRLCRAFSVHGQDLSCTSCFNRAFIFSSSYSRHNSYTPKTPYRNKCYKGGSRYIYICISVRVHMNDCTFIYIHVHICI